MPWIDDLLAGGLRTILTAGDVGHIVDHEDVHENIDALRLFLPPTPDADGLEDAIDAANSMGGGCVLLPSVIHLDRAPVTPIGATNVHVRGQGNGATHVIFDGADPTIALGFSLATNCSFSHFSVSRATKTYVPNTSAAVQFFGSTNCHIFNVESYWQSGFNLYLRGCTASSVHNCYVHDGYLDGIHIAGNWTDGGGGFHFTTGIEVHHNFVTHMGDDGIGVTGEGFGTDTLIDVHDNVVYENGGSVVGYYGGAFCTIHHNLGAYTSASGIAIETPNAVWGAPINMLDVHHNILAGCGQYFEPNIWYAEGHSAGIEVWPDATHGHYIENLSITDNLIWGAANNYILIGTNRTASTGASIGKVTIERNICDGGISAGLPSAPNAAGGTWTQTPGNSFTQSTVGDGIVVCKGEIVRVNHNEVQGATKHGVRVLGMTDGSAWSSFNAFGVRYYVETLDNIVSDAWQTYAGGDQIAVIRVGGGPVVRATGNTVLDPNGNGNAQVGGLGVPVAVNLTDAAVTAESYIGGNHWPKGTTLPWVVFSRAVGATGQPTFANSWVNFGGGSPTTRFYKDGEGRVHLAGRIKSGTIATAAFTLPAGYRPAQARRFAVESNSAFGAVQVGSDGTVVPAVGSNADFRLDGVSFTAET